MRFSSSRNRKRDLRLLPASAGTQDQKAKAPSRQTEEAKTGLGGSEGKARNPRRTDLVAEGLRIHKIEEGPNGEKNFTPDPVFDVVPEDFNALAATLGA